MRLLRPRNSHSGRAGQRPHHSVWANRPPVCSNSEGWPTLGPIGLRASEEMTVLGGRIRRTADRRASLPPVDNSGTSIRGIGEGEDSRQLQEEESLGRLPIGHMPSCTAGPPPPSRRACRRRDVAVKPSAGRGHDSLVTDRRFIPSRAKYPQSIRGNRRRFPRILWGERRVGMIRPRLPPPTPRRDGSHSAQRHSPETAWASVRAGGRGPVRRTAD